MSGPEVNVGKGYGEVSCALREVKPMKEKNRCSIYVRDRRKMESCKNKNIKN